MSPLPSTCPLAFRFPRLKQYQTLVVSSVRSAVHGFGAGRRRPRPRPLPFFAVSSARRGEWSLLDPTAAAASASVKKEAKHRHGPCCSQSVTSESGAGVILLLLRIQPRPRLDAPLNPSLHPLPVPRSRSLACVHWNTHHVNGVFLALDRQRVFDSLSCSPPPKKPFRTRLLSRGRTRMHMPMHMRACHRMCMPKAPYILRDARPR